MFGFISNKVARKKAKRRSKSNKKNTGMFTSMKVGFNKFANSTAGKATGSFLLTSGSVLVGTLAASKLTGRK